MQQTVALCDSRRLFGDALSAILSKEPDLVFAGQAVDGNDALRLVSEQRPDLLLLDVSLRDASALELARELRARTPDLKIVMLADESGLHVEPLMAAGVNAIVMRQQPWATVVEALRLALRGQSYVAPEITSRPAPVSTPPGGIARASRGLERLTARERQIFDLIVSGYKNQEIATLLGVSIKTVETHRASINRKLSVHSTGQMIRFAATQGLIPQSAEVQARRSDFVAISPTSVAQRETAAVGR